MMASMPLRDVLSVPMMIDHKSRNFNTTLVSRLSLFNHNLRFFQFYYTTIFVKSKSEGSLHFITGPNLNHYHKFVPIRTRKILWSEVEVSFGEFLGFKFENRIGSG